MIDGQLMRRKRVSPVLNIEDLDSLESLFEDENVMGRKLGVGGSDTSEIYWKSDKSGKSDKSSKGSKGGGKGSKGSKSSKMYQRSESSALDLFLDMSLSLSLSLSLSMPSSPTPPSAPTPTEPLPSSTPSPVESPTSSLPPTLVAPIAPVSVVPSTPTTAAPSAASPTTGGSGECANLPREQAMAEILTSVTSSTLLNDASTPQGMAFRWLLDNDEAQIDPCTYPGVAQRYALATFYYSTNGDGWTDNSGWLTGGNECMWLGITCEEDLVDELSLGK
jgi:hypothetical protein